MPLTSQEAGAYSPNQSMVIADPVMRFYCRSLLLSLVVVALSCSIGSATESPAAPPADDVTRYVEPYVRMRDFSGVVVVAKGQHILYKRAYGEANTSRSKPNTISTAYMVGSISKTFTAAAIELLVRRGELRYTAKLSSYVPEYRHGNGVTIQELLEHSAGIPDYYALPEFARDRIKNMRLTELVAWLNAYPLDFKPGSKSSYSNSGYSLLALVIERVSHQRYGDFLQRNIFIPFSLRHTGVREAGTADALAQGYDPASSPRFLQATNAIAVGWLVGNGSVYSTADDMSRWLDLAAGGKRVNFSGLPFPFGWSAASDGLDQDGRIPGFASMVWVKPKSGLKVIVLSNIQCAAAITIANDLVAAWSGKRLSPPPLRRLVHVATTRLDKYTGFYSFGPSLTLVVSRNRNDLLLKNAADGINYPLEPTGRDRFFFRPLYVYVRFASDKKGHTAAMDWNGQFTIPKVDRQVHEPAAASS
jgi:CubicO group peptidase (beta-lactamase class C family)